MCAACVAQGAAYLVPAYAVVKTRSWQRRRKPTSAGTRLSRPEPSQADDPAVRVDA